MKLVDMNLFVDGYGFIGKLQSFTPPVIEEVVEEFNGGGLGGSIEIPMDRVGVTEATWVVSTHEKALTSAIMKSGISAKARGYAVELDGTRVPISYELRGRITRHDEGEQSPGGENSVTQRMSVMKYTKKVNDEETIHLDKLSRILRFNGVDMWADVRRALGI